MSDGDKKRKERKKRHKNREAFEKSKNKRDTCTECTVWDWKKGKKEPKVKETEYSTGRPNTMILPFSQ